MFHGKKWPAVCFIYRHSDSIFTQISIVSDWNTWEWGKSVRFLLNDKLCNPVVREVCWLLFASHSEFVWRSQLRNAWLWRSSLIAPRPEMRLEETLLWLWLMPAVCCLPSACLLSVFIHSRSFFLVSLPLAYFGLFVCISLSVMLSLLQWTGCAAASPAYTAVKQWDMQWKQATQTFLTHACTAKLYKRILPDKRQCYRGSFLIFLNERWAQCAVRAKCRG